MSWCCFMMAQLNLNFKMLYNWVWGRVTWRLRHRIKDWASVSCSQQTLYTKNTEAYSCNRSLIVILLTLDKLYLRVFLLIVPARESSWYTQKPFLCHAEHLAKDKFRRSPLAIFWKQQQLGTGVGDHFWFSLFGHRHLVDRFLNFHLSKSERLSHPWKPQEMGWYARNI